MRLFIAEKPSLARAIADALPGPKKKADGHITVGDDIVSWCIGHLLEQAEPDAYDPAFKRWSHDHLPIVPDEWQWVPKTKTRSQLSVLRKLVKSADQIVHAGDPDREGQLLVDEVIDYLKVPAAKKKAMQRCLIADLNASAVKRSLNQLKTQCRVSGAVDIGACTGSGRLAVWHESDAGVYAAGADRGLSGCTFGRAGADAGSGFGGAAR